MNLDPEAVALDSIFTGDSQLFKTLVYAEDGVTPVTPVSCSIKIWNADTGVVELTDTAGTIGAGFAQYNWAGTSTPANYEALLTVAISATVTKTVKWRVLVAARPANLVFTYDISAEIGQVRLHLGDNKWNAGVMPDSSNFSDAELQVFLDRHGEVSGTARVMRAVADLCELLAVRWSAMTDVKVGSRSDAMSKVSGQYAKRAEELREKYGESGAVVSVGHIRVDGFSDGTANDAVSTPGTDYESEFVYVRPG